MKRELIEQILQYHEEHYPQEHYNALEEFFGADVEITEITGKREAFFIEWLLFDYHLPNGKSYIENFLKENYEALSASQMQACADFLHNEYGYFRVKKIYEKKGMLLTNIITDNDYHVQEKNITRQAHIGDTLIARVGKVGDHWEIVSGVAELMGKVSVDKEFIKQWRKEHDRITPKTIYDVLYKNDLDEKESQDIIEHDIDPEKSQEDFGKFLHTYGVDTHINVRLVQKWINNMGTKNALVDEADEIVMILMSFMANNPQYDDIMRDLLPVLSNLNNTTPQKRLDGRSPMEKMNDLGDYEPDMHMKVQKAPSGDGVGHINKGVTLMHEDRVDEAREEIEAGFSGLLERKFVLSDPYRPYANLAGCYVAVKQYDAAVHLLVLALLINPNYGFAGRSLQKFFKDEIDPFDTEFLKALKSDTVRSLSGKHPAKKYARFLKKTGINFRTINPTEDAVQDFKYTKH